MDHITLDREVFKALASDTRLDLLKALDERRKTVTELARELNFNKATVFEHMEKLLQVGLAEKIEDERKWVYYQLTWKGRRLLHPEKITIALLLSSALASLVTALGAGFAYFVSRSLSGDAGDSAPESAPADGRVASAPQAEETMVAPTPAPAEGSEVPGVTEGEPLLWVAVALAVVALALGAYAAWVWRRSKREPAGIS